MLSENNTQENKALSPIKKSIKTIKSSNDLFQNQNKYNNCHLLSRKDTMYLSSLNSNDYPIRKFKQMSSNREWSLNLYNLDIDGTQPRKFGIFTNKVDFINKNDDIERSNPKIIHYHLKKPEYNLSNRDIEKSFPSAVHFKTKRVTNPLEPKYKFSEGESYPPEIHKFIRDSIDIKDIEGASPQKKIYFLKKETNCDKLSRLTFYSFIHSRKFLTARFDNLSNFS